METPFNPYSQSSTQEDLLRSLASNTPSKDPFHLKNAQNSSIQKLITASKASSQNITQALSASWQLSASSYVQESSQNTYQTGWNHYLKFCLSLGIDPCLKVVNTDIQINTMFSYNINILLMFQQSLAIFQKAKPSTISNYMSGVKYNFNSLLIPTDEFDNDIFRRVRQSLAIQYKSVYGLEHRSKRLPFTMDMILQGQNIISTHDTTEYLAFNAILTGFFLLLRSSELVPTKADHHLLSQHVVFLFENDNDIEEIPSYEIKPLKHYGILKGVFIFIRSQKNDPMGMGTKYHFQTEPISPTYDIDLSTELLKCSRRNQPLQNKPFLSNSLENTDLSYDQYLKTCKKIAQFCKFDPNLFGTHSVRIGGATTLAAAEVPNHYIQKMGGWKSITFLEYIRTSLHVVNNSKMLLANKSTFNNQHLKLSMQIS